MTETDLETRPRKPITDALKSVTDRVTRERSEHPDRLPREAVTHPVTRAEKPRRERVGE